MPNAEPGAPAAGRAKLRNSTTVFLVGNIERHAWNVYIITDDVKALFEEYSASPGVKISRQLCRQDYGMMEFDVIDLNGHRLVFAQPISSE